MEEFAPKFVCCPGKDDVLVDSFCWLPQMDKPTEGKSWYNKGAVVAFDKIVVLPVEDEICAAEVDVVLSPTEEEMGKLMLHE